MRHHITTNALNRTVQIQSQTNNIPNGTATGFFIDVDGREYFVTAKHCIPDFQTGHFLRIQQNNQWAESAARLVGHAADDIDISVLALDQRMTYIGLAMESTAAGIALSQDVYFLGFPYGMRGDLGNDNNGLPAPFVKLSILSASEEGDRTLKKIYLDGVNNPGFSGGPAVFFDPQKGAFKIAGVISGYRNDAQPVYEGENKLNAYVMGNSGIIVAYGIEYAVRLARADGRGPL